MNAEQSRWRLTRQFGGDDGAPVATLGDVARVAEASHQLGPDLRDVFGTPTGRGWFPGKAVTRYRWNHDIESVRGGTSMRDRVRERTDRSEELEHRAGPTVRDEQRHRVLFLRLHLNEVNVESVDVGHELWQGVELRLRFAPVVTGAPVFHQLLEPGELRALRLIGDGFLIRPARR